MLVCNVSLRPPRIAIAASLEEQSTAVDALATSNVVFATLVDDPASVGDIVDAYLGEIMLEAMTAIDQFDGTIAVIGSSTATFDPSTAIATTLSNGDLTATHNNTASNTGVYCTAFKTSGKYYFELTAVTMNVIGGFSDIIGAITSSGTISGVMGTVGNCLVVLTSSGQVYSNGFSFGTALGAVVASDVIGVAVDLTARLGWVRKNGGNWNGSGTANPATGTGGAPLYATVGYAPLVTFNASSVVGSQYTLNTGATAYANAAPSGFGNF